MSALTWFAVHAAFIVHFASSGPSLLNECNFTASVETTVDQGQYTVEIRVENSEEGLEYFFFNAERELQNIDSKRNKWSTSEKGQYFCIITKGTDCHKKIDFTL